MPCLIAQSSAARSAPVCPPEIRREMAGGFTTTVLIAETPIDSLSVKIGRFRGFASDFCKKGLALDRPVNYIVFMKQENETRIKLLKVAVEMIWESSYGSVSVEDICERAGVKKGSFYYAFKSKSDLAVAAFEYYW